MVVCCFFLINFAIHDSKTKEIRRICLCNSIGSKKLCRILFLQLTSISTWFLLLIDSWCIFEGNFCEEYTVISQKLSSENFTRNTVYLLLLFSCLLDLFKTSVYCTPKNNFLQLNIFAKSSIIDIRLDSEYTSELSIKYFSQL